jgi:DNA-nicking Smr family endonuclease
MNKMEPIKIPIEDILDLHHFRPQEVSALLSDYLAECRKVRIFSVRIIHGKGHGILKNLVRQHLKNNPIVSSFQDAPFDAGGWGATLVELKTTTHYPTIPQIDEK